MQGVPFCPNDVSLYLFLRIYDKIILIFILYEQSLPSPALLNALAHFLLKSEEMSSTIILGCSFLIVYLYLELNVGTVSFHTKPKYLY